MPDSGSQCWFCDLPVRFDTYKGCSHGCEYCFVQRTGKYDLKDIKRNETREQLLNFIRGGRNQATSWCDWNIPLHWGGVSDPFQPCEKQMRVSYEALKVFAETGYPFIVSTKGKLVADDEYLELLERCNCVVQISAVCPSYDAIEKGCPTFDERIEIMEKVAPRVKRLIVRCQPYMHEVFDEVYASFERLKNAGVYGVTVEGMKFTSKRSGLIKLGADFVYPYEIIKGDFLKLKKRAHEIGLKIYAGENRIRQYGDSLTCCGCDGLEGFEPNVFNLNHLLHGDHTKPTKGMQEMGTGYPFRAIPQNTIEGDIYTRQSFAYNMLWFYKGHKTNVHKVLGITH